MTYVVYEKSAKTIERLFLKTIPTSSF